MAHNNDFFFKSLVGPSSYDRSPTPNVIPQELEGPLIRSFGSIATLRDELLTTAEAMFGPGFVWLVQVTRGDFRILATYNAGSPYAEAHNRLQPVDLNTQNVGGVGGLTSEEWQRQNVVQNHLGQMGAHTKETKRPGGLTAQPVLCVNTWEHVWAGLYGLGRKRLYLETWWDHVDWSVVLERCLGQLPTKDNFETR